MRRTAPRGLAGSVAVLCACSSPNPQENDPAPPCDDLARATPAIEIGTGAVSFESIADGAELPIVWGGQGGLHVWSSLRAQNIYPGPRGSSVDATSPFVEFRVEAEGRRINFAFREQRNLRVRKDSTLELVGEVVVLASPMTSIGRFVNFSVTLDDACGASVSDARDVTLVDPNARERRKMR